MDDDFELETKEGEVEDQVDVMSDDLDNVLDGMGSAMSDLFNEEDGGNDSTNRKRKRSRDDSAAVTRPAVTTVTVRGEGRRGTKLRKGEVGEKARMLYRLQNNIELLEGLNNSIISINEKEFISGYFTGRKLRRLFHRNTAPEK